MSMKDTLAGIAGMNTKEALGALAKIIRDNAGDRASLATLATELGRMAGPPAKPAGTVEKQATEENTPKAAPPEVASKEEATAKEAAAKEPKKTTKKAAQDESGATG